MNFDMLRQKIEHATKKAFIELFENCGADEIYGFALYSDGGAMTVCPSTNTLKCLTSFDQNDDLTYYKFEPAEWKYEALGADKEFDEICYNLRNELEKYWDDDKGFEKFRKQLFDTCIEILEKLKNENFFRQIVGKDIFLIFTVSDYEFEINELKDIIVRLNDNEYKVEYLNWMKIILL